MLVADDVMYAFGSALFFYSFLPLLIASKHLKRQIAANFIRSGEEAEGGTMWLLFFFFYYWTMWIETTHIQLSEWHFLSLKLFEESRWVTSFQFHDSFYVATFYITELLHLDTHYSSLALSIPFFRQRNFRKRSIKKCCGGGFRNSRNAKCEMGSRLMWIEALKMRWNTTILLIQFKMHGNKTKKKQKTYKKQQKKQTEMEERKAKRIHKKKWGGWKWLIWYWSDL